MANSQDIQDIISESSKKSLLDAQKNAEGLNKVLQDTILYAKQANDNLSGAKSMADFDKKAKAAELAQERINLATARTQKAQEQLIAIELSNQQKRDAYEKKQLEADAKRIASIEKKRKAIVSNSQSEIDAYNNAAKSEKDWIAVSNQNNKAQNQAAVTASTISGKIKETTKAVVANSVSLVDAEKKSSSFANVLSTGATKAFGVLRNIAYLVPGLGIAGLLGLLSEPLLDAIANLNLFKKTIDQIKVSREALNSVNLKGGQDAQQEVVELKTLYSTAKNVLLTSEQRYNAAKKLQEQYPETFKNYTVEQIELGKVDGAYLKLSESILATARARASEQKIAENSSRQLSNEFIIREAEIEYNKQRIIAETALAKLRDPANAGQARFLANEAATAEERRADAAKIIREARKDTQILDQRNLDLTKNIVAQQLKGAEIAGAPKDPKKAKDNSKELEKNARDSAAALVEIDLIASREVEAIYAKQSENINFSLEARLTSFKNSTQEQRRIVMLEAEKELVGKENTAEEELLIRENLVSKLEKIEVDAGIKSVAIMKQTLSEREKIILEQNQKNLTEIERQRDAEILSLNDRNLSEKKYADARADIEKKYTLAYIDEQIKQTQAAIDAAKARGDNTDKAEADIYALRLKYSDLKNKLIKSEIDIEKEAAELRKQIAVEIFNLTKSLVSLSYENRINDLNKQKEQLEENKNLQIENVNEGVLAEEDKAARINVINAQAAQQQEAIDAKIAEQKRKQAIADKAFAISQIIINTAVAVSKTVAQTGLLGLPLTPLILALGAIQIASVIAQPIPKFKDGKSKGNNYEGLAYVGDGGQSELVINKDGSSWVTPATSTLTYVGKDTQVISGPELARMRMMAKPDQGDVVGKSWDVSPLIAESQRSTKEMKRAIGQLVTKNKRNNRVFDMQSWNAHLKRNGL